MKKIFLLLTVALLFAARFLFALSEGRPLVECAKFASATAACSVEVVGAVAGVTSFEKVSARFESAR